jgi:hypothetical protein
MFCFALLFCVCFTDNFQGRIMTKITRYDLKFQTACLVVDLNSVYSLELSCILRSYFEALGGDGFIAGKKYPCIFENAVDDLF